MTITVNPPLVAFEDNDRDYLFWTRRNSRGYVVNCYRNPTPDYLILHWADCYTINGTHALRDPPERCHVRSRGPHDRGADP